MQLSLIEEEELNEKLLLISPFVGGKSKAKYKGIHDKGDYDVSLEPFTGGAGFTLAHPDSPRRLIGADADPSVRAIWEVWDNPWLRPLANDRVAFWSKQFKHDGSWEETVEKGLRAWEFLEQEFNYRGNPGVPGVARKAWFAAASIVLRRLIFGPVRVNGHGKLNISLNYKARKGKSKLESFQSWQHQWPKHLDYCNISPHWNLAIIKLKRSQFERAIAVIDPPYWVPYEPGTDRRGSGAMTASYPGHKPSHDGLFWDGINAIDAAFSTGKVRRCVVFNYISNRMNNAIHTLAKRHDMPCHLSNLGPLGNMNNAQNFHGRFDEGVWEIGGDRMFRDLPRSTAVEDEAESSQGSIFSLLECA